MRTEINESFIREFIQKNRLNAHEVSNCFGRQHESCEFHNCQTFSECKQCWDEMSRKITSNNNTESPSTLNSLNEITLPKIIPGAVSEIDSKQTKATNNLNVVTCDKKINKINENAETVGNEKVKPEVIFEQENNGIIILKEIEALTMNLKKDFIAIGIKLKEAKALLKNNFEKSCAEYIGLSPDTINNFIRVAEKFKTLPCPQLMQKIPYSGFVLLSQKNINDDIVQKIFNIAEKKEDRLKYNEMKAFIKKLTGENKASENNFSGSSLEEKKHKENYPILNFIGQIEKSISIIKSNQPHDINQIDSLLKILNEALTVINDIKKLQTKHLYVNRL